MSGSAGNRGAVTTDAEKLKHALTHFLNVDIATYETRDEVKALSAAGVTRWSDFVFLSEKDIDSLVVPADDPNEPPTRLQIIKRRSLICLLAFYHQNCHLLD